MLSHTIEQFLEERAASRYSPNTIRLYKNTFDKFLRNRGDIPIEHVTRDSVIQFLKSQDEVAAKTLRNYHSDLSALWQWAAEKHLCKENIIRSIRAPIAEKKEIIPLTKTETVALLNQARKSHSDALSLRNQAIIYLLLDTGIRASELCAIKIKDINEVTSRITVYGKGRKERLVPISKTAIRKFAEYIKTRNTKNNYVFTTRDNRQLSRHHLRQTLERMGDAAGISHVHPHKFRHTFAIQFLRNGGNIYSLQKILGHTTLDMVKRYLAIAQIDLDRDHAKASPVEHWMK